MKIDLAAVITRERNLLRQALVGLVGADSKEELEVMEIAIRSMVASDEDKAASLNAIHALIHTCGD